MTRAQKMLHDPRLIYISWLSGQENNELKTWVDQFYEKVTASTGSLTWFEARRSGDELPGTCTNGDELPEGVTDVVGVLTNKYAIEIQKKSSSNPPALNRFFKLKLQDKSDLHRTRRAWITPLQILPLANVLVEGVALKNKEHYWLVVLEDRRKKGRFPWPGEQTEPTWDDEIFYAVKEILGEILD